jgi:hypothetical protein
MDLICVANLCVPARDDGGILSSGGDGSVGCNDDGDCNPGMICSNGQCVTPPMTADLTMPDMAMSKGDMSRTGPKGDMRQTGACHPVLNELQASGATASDEWVEIFNPCNAQEDLTGWKLDYRSAANNNGGNDITCFAFGQTIPAGGYLLLAGKGYTGSVNADGVLSSGLADGGGAVGLRDANGALVDSVAFQTLTAANSFTEGSPAQNPPASRSIARLPNGADTQNNSKDFQVTAKPTPRAANQ